MNEQMQWQYDISLWMASSDYGANFPMPVSGVVWPYEAQAIAVIQANGGTVPQPPSPPDPARQAAIERYDVDDRLCAYALTKCFMSLPQPVLADYLDNPDYVWPYRSQAESCPGNTPI